mmetsp:Transcript_9397/g.19240  ORF Transcript_9397/g.19240 Transcript_9397/m.19240 type:complete len:317 (+) Transcript_9397:302-1252(+)
MIAAEERKRRSTSPAEVQPTQVVQRRFRICCLSRCSALAPIQLLPVALHRAGNVSPFLMRSCPSRAKREEERGSSSGQLREGHVSVASLIPHASMVPVIRLRSAFTPGGVIMPEADRARFVMRWDLVGDLTLPSMPKSSIESSPRCCVAAPSSPCCSDGTLPVAPRTPPLATGWPVPRLAPFPFCPCDLPRAAAALTAGILPLPFAGLPRAAAPLLPFRPCVASAALACTSRSVLMSIKRLVKAAIVSRAKRCATVLSPISRAARSKRDSDSLPPVCCRSKTLPVIGGELGGCGISFTTFSRNESVSTSTDCATKF